MDEAAATVDLEADLAALDADCRFHRQWVGQRPINADTALRLGLIFGLEALDPVGIDVETDDLLADLGEAGARCRGYNPAASSMPCTSAR
jgi:hypothetical protein